MPSPFPGMDPYLEGPDVWQDFHAAYVPALRAELVPQLPDRYVAKVEESVYIREPSAEERRLAGRPDATLALTAPPAAGVTPAASAGLVAPVTAYMVPMVEVSRVPYLEIVDRLRRTVVTVIELLSPSNKQNVDDREAYLLERRRIRASLAHFVEIDLLRGGPRMPLDGLPPCDYYGLVSRVQDRPTVGVWPVRLRDPLPTLPIPLAGGDADVRLDLRAALDRVYDDAGYARFVYANEVDPPLPTADAAWAAERVAAVARRS